MELASANLDSAEEAVEVTETKLTAARARAHTASIMHMKMENIADPFWRSREFRGGFSRGTGPKPQAIVQENIKVKKEGVDEEQNQNAFPPEIPAAGGSQVVKREREDGSVAAAAHAARPS